MTASALDDAALDVFNDSISPLFSAASSRPLPTDLIQLFSHLCAVASNPNQVTGMAQGMIAQFPRASTLWTFVFFTHLSRDLQPKIDACGKDVD